MNSCYIESKPFTAIQRESKLLLCLHDSGKRRKVQGLLPQSLSVEVNKEGIGQTPFDLCILDAQSFEQNKDTLRALKDEMAPIFLPVLLLCERNEKTCENTDILEFVDDVLNLPISEELVRTRLQILLKQRRYSLQLDEKNKALDQVNRKLNIYRQAINSTKEGILITDAQQEDNPIIYCNEGFSKLTGYPEEEIIGRNCRFLQEEDRNQEAIDQIRELIQKGEKGQVNLRNYRKDGSLFWNQLSIAPIKNENSEITHFIGVQKDITELIESHQSFVDEKQLLDTALKSLPGLFYMIDEDQKFVKWNKNLEEELGYSSQEIENMHPLDFHEEKDHELIKSKIAEVLKNGSAEVEVEIQHKNGDPFPYYITGEKFSRGGNDYIVGTCTNLSELKEAERKSKQQKQLLEAIINQTEAIIYVKDAEGRNKLVNDAYLSLFNLKRDEVIGKTDQEVHGNLHADNVRGNDQKVIETGESMEVEEQIPVDGSIRYYRTIKNPLKGVLGFENHICGISTDITDQKKTMGQLQERIKEQSCLYNISKLGEKDLTIPELLRQAVELLPSGWQYPEITEAAINFDGKTYQTEDYRETNWQLRTESNRIEDKPLDLVVSYSEERVACDEGPFLKEERQLIDTIADTLTAKIDRIRSNKKINASKEKWKNLFNNDPNLIQILKKDGTIELINPAGARFLNYENPKELVGKKIYDLVWLYDIEKTRERLKKLAAGQELPPTVLKIRVKATGQDRYFESRSVPVALDNGEMGIQQVGQDITDRIHYEQQLKEALREKEVLLQEVHHRVKNNLAVVAGLLKIQRYNSDDKSLSKILGNCEMRIHSMGIIHEKLYQTQSFSSINFKTYAENLVDTLEQTLKVEENIEIITDCEPVTMNVNQAVPCGLIINELITNALEHAFEDRVSGKICLKVHSKGEHLHVTVQDNGKGIPHDFKKAQQMGYTIIDTLIRQLNATMDVQNGDGSTIHFWFTKKEIKGSVSSIFE